MTQLLYDLRHGWRSLRERPGFTLLVVAILGLGVGANVAIFGLAHTLFLRHLPVEGAERLVGVYETRANQGYYPMSWANYVDYREASTVFEELASHYSGSPMHASSQDRSGMLNGSVVSDNYFSMLRIEPESGRLLLPEDFEPGSAPVAVLGYQIWQNWFDARPEVLGQTLDINGVTFAVVGVVPEEFRGVLVGKTNDVWIASSRSDVAYRFCDPTSRDCTYLDVLGRLAPGQDLAQAQTELDLIARRLEQAYPRDNGDVGVAVAPARGAGPDSAGSQARTTRVLVLIVAAVLLIACANLAALLLARNWARSGELAIRRALGASRWRILALLLSESLLLCVLGGGCALFVGWALRRLLLSFYDLDAGWLTSTGSVPVLLFTIGLSLATGLVFGGLPAHFLSRVDSSALVRARDRSAGRWRGALVGIQLALCLVLLVGTSLLTRSLLYLEGAGPFSTERLVTLRLRPRLAEYDLERSRSVHLDLVEHLLSVPEVESVSYGKGLAPWPYDGPVEVRLPGQSSSTSIGRIEAGYDHVAPGYFDTISLPLLRGRGFQSGDDLDSPPVVVVNEPLAARLWPTGEALDRGVVIDEREHRVVGVVPSAHRRRSDQGPIEYFYLPYLQSDLVDSRLVVRTRGQPEQQLELLRSEIARVDPVLPVSEVSPLDVRIAQGYRTVRLAGAVTASSGAVGLLLSAVGLYGVLAFGVARRRREIGIRIAVGARRQDILGLIVGEGARLAVFGALLGAPLAVALPRVLGGVLYGVSPHRPVDYLVVALVLFAVALLASWAPARRAASVEPISSLRAE